MIIIIIKTLTELVQVVLTAAQVPFVPHIGRESKTFHSNMFIFLKNL